MAIICISFITYADTYKGATSTIPTYNKEQAVKAVREALKSRKASIKFLYKIKSSENTLISDINKERKDILKKAVAHTGKGDEGDYIAGVISHRGSGSSLYDYIDETDIAEWEMVYDFKYRDTAGKETIVKSTADSVLASMNLSGKSDYTKAKTIYNYVINRAVYDNDAAYASMTQSDFSRYYDSFTAYGPLIKKKACCQGYALLIYRMCNQAGVSCRIVTGTAKADDTADSHMWLIIKINGLYYECDPTWDSAYMHAGRGCPYFLKANLQAHAMDSETLEKIKGLNLATTSYMTPVSNTRKLVSAKSSPVTIKKYRLTVKGGTGSGIYKSGSVVTISPWVISGKKFVKWKGSAKYAGGTSNKTKKAKIKITKNTTLTAVTSYKPIKGKSGKYRIRLSDGKYLRIIGNSKKAGAEAGKGRKYSRSAVFRLIKSGNAYYIQNIHSKKYLGINKNRIIQTSKAKAQKWILVAAGNEKYRLVSNGKAITNGTQIAADRNKAVQKISLDKA